MYRIKVITLCQDAMSHQNSVPTELLKFIHDWWRDHILTSDMKYKDVFTTPCCWRSQKQVIMVPALTC